VYRVRVGGWRDVTALDAVEERIVRGCHVAVAGKINLQGGDVTVAVKEASNHLLLSCVVDAPEGTLVFCVP